MGNLLGKRIQELRKQVGITQEELSKATGVSTQAVSKWECGGSPDAELLPVIADYFHVRIDYLFGRDDVTKMELPDVVFKELFGKERAEQLKVVFEILFMMENAIGKIPVNEVMPSLDEILVKDTDMSLYYHVLMDDVYSKMRLMEDFHYFLYVEEPRQGFQSVLPEEQVFTEFFRMLGNPHRFSILYYLHSRKNGVTKERLTHSLHVEEKEIEAALCDLVEHKYVGVSEIDTKEGVLKAYSIEVYDSFLPFLIFTAEYMSRDIYMGYCSMTREFPILSKHEEVV